VTRRQVLVGSTAASAALLLAGSSSEALEVFHDSNGVVVRINGRSWLIDRASFGERASLEYYRRGDEHWIRLTRTVSTEIGLSTDFVARLRVVAGQWWLSIRFPHIGASLRVPLSPWLENLHSAQVRVDGIPPIKSAEPAPFLIHRRETLLSLTPDWRLRWQADEPILSVSLHGARFSAREACLSIGRRSTTDLFDVLDEYSAPGTASLELLGLAIDAPRAEPGRVGKHALSLTFDAVRRAEIGIVSRRDGGSASAFTLLGEAEVSANCDGAGGADAHPDFCGLRLSPVALVQPIGSRQCLMTARVSRAAHAIETANVVMSIAGSDNDGIVATFRNRMAAPLSIPAELHEVHVPVAGADIAKITFTAIPFRIVLGKDAEADPGSEHDPWLSVWAEQAVEPIPAQARRAQKPPAGQKAAVAEENPAAAASSPSGGLLVLDRAPFFIAPLEKGRLQVLRSQDLLSLTFGFRNFAIRVENHRAWLVARRIEPAVGAQPDPDALAHKLIVEFPPQHVAEHAKKTQLGIGPTPADIEQRNRLTGNKGTPIVEKPFEPVVRARLSRSSRLVFKVKPDNAQAFGKKELSVKTLTEWSELAQVVSERALPLDTSLLDQLKLVGIDKGTNRAEALAKIIQSIRPPREDETAIEFPYRLLLSPDQRAKWITPPHRLGAPKNPTPLWNARLDPVDGGKSVRAIWARDILLDFLRGNPPADRDPNRSEFNEPSTAPNGLPLTLSLSRSDRRELVTLSSVYALPALRRIVFDKDHPADHPSGLDPKTNSERIDSAGTVVPFPSGIGLWDRRDPKKPASVKDEGIYVPKPLAAADLLLTAMGGTFVGEGQWEPPSPIVYDKNEPDLYCDPNTLRCDPDLKDNWFPNLRLERWRHRAVLGRDIFVEIAYKGFLFPIGHRASLLKVTERRFYPNPVNNRPTAYLIQRLFIVIGNREKHFPAVGQAHDGRLWPAHTITMVTGRTPDIVDPEDQNDSEKNGRIILKKEDGSLAQGLVFWPRTAQDEVGNFEFQFRKDRDAEPIRAPLVFVDNVAAHIPDTMRALVKKYREEVKIGLRTARHGSVRRRYAPSQKDGETDFDTQSWELSATGRFIEKMGGGPLESFRMDGIMEGADQPPYYPVMRTANITVQSLDRLVGKPAGGMTVAFNELFVRHAFAADQNPSELFLDVLSPAIQLDFSGGGDAVGGFAKPSTRVVALSRKFGPVGGRGPQSSSNGSRGALRMAGDAQSAPIGGLENLPPTGDFKAFAEGRFDPKEFLGGADKLPKLLGIFPLADVLKAVSFAGANGTKKLVAGVRTSERDEKEQKVPKLQEQMSFGGGGGGVANQLAEARRVIEEVAKTLIGDGSPGSGLLGKALSDIDEAVDKKFKGKLNWRSLYPRLTGAFDLLLSRIREARDALGTASLPELFALASAVVAAGNALIAEAQAVRDNPMPPLVGEILADVANEWEKIRKLAKLTIDGAEKKLDEIAATLKNQILGAISELCGELVKDPRVLELLFGEGFDKATCTDFANIDPEQVYKRLSNALLYEVAGEPIARAHTALRTLAAEISAIISDNARDVAPKLIALTNKVFDAALALARIAETSGVFTAAGELAQWCTDAIEFAAYVSDELMFKGKALAEQIDTIASQLAGLQLPAQTPLEIRVRVDQARAALGQAHERVARAVTQLVSLRADLVGCKGKCGKITDALNLTGKIFALRRDAMAAVQDLVLQASVIAKVLDEIAAQHKRAPAFQAAVAKTAFDDDLGAAKRAVKLIVEKTLVLIEGITSINKAQDASTQKNIEDRFKLLAAKLTGPLKRHLDEIQQAIKDLLTASKALYGTISKLRDPGGLLEKWVKGEPFPPDLAALGGDALSYATQHDRRLAALVLQAATTFNTLKGNLSQTAAKALREVASPLVAVHDLALSVLGAVAKVFDTVNGTDEEKRRAAFLLAIINNDVVAAFKDTAQVQEDRKQLAEIKSKANDPATWPDAFKQADNLRKQWAQQEPALIRSTRALARIIESLAHGDLYALIDLARVRELLEAELKKALAAFVPTKLELHYDWKTEIQNFGELFKMTSGPNESDLVLSASVKVDLLNPGGREVVVTGKFKPFTVFILEGGSFLTLKFGEPGAGGDDALGAHFTSINGGKPDFKANLQDVLIGPGLAFVQMLASFLSYGDDSGFYVRVTIFPPGIEAGFEYHEDIVPLGGLILYNAGFSVSAKLPFEDRDARFRFAVASADAPLIISYPPYGGGGFVAMTANGREFVEVECSFEFGAIVGISFGPLSAIGRVMAGIYIRFAHGGGAYIKGFVHAVGEGSIACFSICVNIEVAIIHYPDGHMEGSSTYEITFKVGIAELSYGFTASYSVAGGSGGGGRRAALFDARKHPMVKAGCHADEIHYRVVDRVPPKTRRWKDYRKNFDLGLLDA
jgi:hypothetical protein